jgi:hypothetical protein
MNQLTFFRNSILFLQIVSFKNVPFDKDILQNYGVVPSNSEEILEKTQPDN